MPNFLIQEICSFVEPGDKERVWADWFGFAPMRMVDGKFPLPQKPGLGFDLTEAALANIPSAAHGQWLGFFRPMALWESGETNQISSRTFSRTFLFGFSSEMSLLGVGDQWNRKPA